MNSSTVTRAFAAADCEIACDDLTRHLYATDASIYQRVPVAVAFPRSAAQAAAAIRAAAEAEIPVTPRGAGTGLTGGAVGDGLVVDFARHNRGIHSPFVANSGAGVSPVRSGSNGRDARATSLTGGDIGSGPSVHVGAGVVLDQLNAFLKPHGLAFGPDVATSSRATLGGMIANNSSGARVPLYGVTADHVLSLEVVMADGTIARLGAAGNGPPPLRRAMQKLVAAHAAAIGEQFPPGLAKHWPGYGLERFLHRRASLTELVAGSEGTLAGIWSAELRAVPLPREKGLGLIYFASIAEAMQATVELLDLKPAAIEHLDRILLDQTRGEGAFAAARALMDLEARPCESVLVVEFYDDVPGRLAALAARRLGLRSQAFTSAAEMDLVWNLRKAGLSLLQSCPGRAKPREGIEDAAVLPSQLPEYVRGLQTIFGRLGLQASFYGHAASGLLHVRPVLDLHDPADRKKYRQVACEVSALVKQFKGSLAAEHGLGMARTEFLGEQIGTELVGVMREVKRAFDPGNVFNPGKIVGLISSPSAVGQASSLSCSAGFQPAQEPAATGRVPVPLHQQDAGAIHYRIDTHLRFDTAPDMELPFAPVLGFVARDGSFLANLDQCNGCGGCRKDTPMMCPTFIATGDEIMSTRGRANTIRAVLEGRLGEADPLTCAELEAALAPCLACKACVRECPSNVNLPLLKAELLNARLRRDGLGLREWLVSRVDLLGQAGTLLPSLANAALGWAGTKRLLQTFAGFSAKRQLPAYAEERFDRWFESRAGRPAGPKIQAAETGSPTLKRGRVLLWDDTFVRYHEPHIGKAAVAVLEAAGFEVLLPRGRQCCGRPAFSQGNLGDAARFGRHNLALLAAEWPELPILFLEPSCWSMFAQDYAELKLPGADAAARRSFLFEDFIENLLAREPDALRFAPATAPVAIHAHCHTKALANPQTQARLARRLPGRTVTLLDTGCCGMAGAFGMMESKYELSLKVAGPLVEHIRRQPEGATIVAAGTSCRQQIHDLTPAKPKHIAELLAEAME